MSYFEVILILKMYIPLIRRRKAAKIDFHIFQA